MKDKVVSILRIITGIWLVWYIAYLFSINAIITRESYQSLNIAILWLIWIFWVRIFITGFKAFFFPRQKLIHFLTWLFLIILWSYILQDNPNKNIFLADILNIWWAFLMITGPMWVLINERMKKLKDEEKIEIIEV